MAKQRKGFVEQGRYDMHDFVVKAIDDLLAVLDSKIEFPVDNDGYVLEHKMFAVVQAREQVYRSAGELMDEIKIEDSNDQAYKNKIIQGLKTTWRELTAIATRDIGELKYSLEEIMSNMDRKLSDEEKKQRARESVTDDRLTSISKAKVLSVKLSYQILDRIALLENPDAANEEILKNSEAINIAEKYVEN